MSWLHDNVWVSFNDCPVHSMMLSVHFPPLLLPMVVPWKIVVERLLPLMRCSFHLLLIVDKRPSNRPTSCLIVSQTVCHLWCSLYRKCLWWFCSISFVMPGLLWTVFKLSQLLSSILETLSNYFVWCKVVIIIFTLLNKKIHRELDFVLVLLMQISVKFVTKVITWIYLNIQQSLNIYKYLFAYYWLIYKKNKCKKRT